MLYRVLCEVYVLYGDEDDQRRDKGGVFKTCCMESWDGKIEHPLIPPWTALCIIVFMDFARQAKPGVRQNALFAFQVECYIFADVALYSVAQERA
jgi:hypothetical protein